MLKRSVVTLLSVGFLTVAPPVGLAQRAQPWPDTYESRLALVALTQTLNAEILGSSSATLSLEKWCRDHKMADDPKIVARLIPGTDVAPTGEQLQRLQVASVSDVKYRRVELRCGSHLFSEADNWYVPGRLTADMNAALETTDTPFGRVVQPLRPYRRTFSVTILWSALPAGWEQQQPKDAPNARGRTLVLPKDLFEHRAVLYTSDNQPFSEVRERYQGQVLDFTRR